MVKCYDHLPPADAFLQIDISCSEAAQILPEYKAAQEDFICIYGLSESAMDDHLLKVQKKADEYAVKLAEVLGKEMVWDIVLKPILLFENKACTILFEDWICSLNDEELNEFIYGLQRDYNQPWTHVQMIGHTILDRIMDRDENRVHNVQVERCQCCM